MKTDRRRSYETVAPFYEELARLLSLGRIGAAKRSQLAYLSASDRVLYAGVGSGEDACEAVHAGVAVSALDLSPRMLARFRRRLGDRGDSVGVSCEDFLDHEGGPYDAIAMNFFLNVFDAQELEVVLDHAVSLLAGSRRRLAIADFAPPRTRLERGVFEVHYRPLLWAAWALGLAALHPIYDYRAALAARGGRIVSEQRFGPYESVIYAFD